MTSMPYHMFLKSYQFAIKWSRWIQNTPKVWCFSSGQPRLRCDVRLKMIGGNQDHWDRRFWAFLTLSSWAFAELNFSSWIRSWWVYCVWRKLSVQECHVNIQATKKLAPCFLIMESDRIGRSEVHSCKKLSMNSTCTVLFLKSLNIRPFVVIYLHIQNEILSF